jgi:hypothetical protein
VLARYGRGKANRNRVFTFEGIDFWVSRPGLFYLWSQAGKIDPQVQRDRVGVFPIPCTECLLADRHWRIVTGTTLRITGMTVGNVECFQASFLELAEFNHVLSTTLLEREYVSSCSEALSRVSDGNKGVIGELKKFNN